MTDVSQDLALSQDQSVPQPATPVGKPRKGSWLRPISATLLAAWLALLTLLAALGLGPAASFVPSLLELHDPGQAARWLAYCALGGLSHVAWYFPVGLLTAWAIGRRQRWHDGLRVVLASAAIGAIAVVVLGLFRGGTLVRPVEFILPLAGCLLGAWFGTAFRDGWKATARRLMVRISFLVLFTAATGLAAALLSLDDKPLDFQMMQFSDADKSRLRSMLKNAERLTDGRRRLRLSSDDANLMLAAALNGNPEQRKARIGIDRETIVIEGSLRLPVGLGQRKWLNARIGCQPKIEEGKLTLDEPSVRVGRLPLPRPLDDAIVGYLQMAIEADPDLHAILTGIDSLEVQPDALEMAFPPDEIGDRIPSLVARLGGKPAVAEETEIHLRHLVAVASSLPRDDERFVALLRSAFQFAQQRSQSGDPVVENRAAILALAIALGHQRVESLVGPVLDRDLRRAIWRELRGVRLRERTDWTRHFSLSAGLAVLSDGNVSDRLGLFKEELDAEKGGSGFSFADLLADRAGTRFALAATRDEASARKMQERLAGDIQLDAIFPPAADLSEGLSEAEFQSRYGGVHGAEYRRMLEELDRRLQSCPMLQ